MQDVQTRLREYMLTQGLSEAALAKRAGVSQSTVSRVLRGQRQRHGAARHKLLTYAKIGEGPAEWSPEAGLKRVTGAFRRIWDGSEAHAVAVANVIGALGDLQPKRRATGSQKGERKRKPTKSSSKTRRLN